MKILKGNLVSAPALGKLEIVEHGCLVLHDDGSIQSVEKAVPQNADAEVIDYGDSLIMPSFVDMHLHAPQYPMLGMGMDLPLIDWLNTYTFKTEARFEDSDYARRIYKKLASDLITSGTTRVCMFSSLHTDATLILMEELEKAGVTGYVGKVNMDRNGSPELQETTEQSKRETLRWLDACGRFQTVKPILTPRFTPSCTDELMNWLGKLAAERGLYVQSHLSENKGEIAWVKELCPDCAQYWESYDRAGLWKDHTVMAHCVHSDEREREAMREHGVVMFGLVQEVPQKETTPFYPRSPYGVAKQYGFWITKNYRESYGMFAVNGILFNHESERRGENFVTRKITLAAARIAQGYQDKLYLGNLDSLRDWGYAKDYVECMWMILQHDTPEDFVIATGEYHTVREFCTLAFKEVGIELRWEGKGVDERGIDVATGKELVAVDPKYFRPAEVEQLLGDPTKAKTLLGWNPRKTSFPELVKIMVKHDMKFVKKLYLKAQIAE